MKIHYEQIKKGKPISKAIEDVTAADVITSDRVIVATRDNLIRVYHNGYEVKIEVINGALRIVKNITETPSLQTASAKEEHATKNSEGESA